MVASRFNQIAGKIHLTDSSTISMCPSGYVWADFQKIRSGIKMHTSNVPCDDSYLNNIILTPEKLVDQTQMDILIIRDKDVLHVFYRDVRSKN